MWWSEFEKRLTRAFNADVERECRVIHLDSMKIWMLIDKIKADFPTPTTKEAHLKIAQSRTPISITYEQSPALFCNMVNQEHPLQMNVANNGAHVTTSMKFLPGVVLGDVVAVVAAFVAASMIKIKAAILTSELTVV